MTEQTPLIEVDNLRVRLNTSRGPADAVRGVSFSLARGETLGLIGESGCGKSVTAMALMGLLPESAVISGSIRLDGQELVGLAEADYCKLRGNRDQHDLSGADDGAQSDAHGRPPGRRAAAPAQGLFGAQAQQGGDCAARPRRPSRCGEAGRCLSAPVFRRPAPAHHHRDGARLRARSPDRGRADHRARCHHPGPDPRPDRRSGGRARHVDDPDFARSRRHRRKRAAHDGDVRRHRGGEAGRSRRCSRASAIPTARACSAPGRGSARRKARGCEPLPAPCPNSPTCLPAAPSRTAAISPKRAAAPSFRRRSRSVPATPCAACAPMSRWRTGSEP